MQTTGQNLTEDTLRSGKRKINSVNSLLKLSETTYYLLKYNL